MRRAGEHIMRELGETLEESERPTSVIAAATRRYNVRQEQAVGMLGEMLAHRTTD